MKKIINGKLYNTETAILIALWSNGYCTSDFGYCSEDLYKTKNGAYFIAGEGGAMSAYAQSCGNNSWGGGEGITPLSKEEALDWCETHDIDIEKCQEEFASLIKEA